MTQTDIEKLKTLFSSNKLNVGLNPNSDSVSIQITGIPLEVSVPNTIRLLNELVEYSIELYKQQQEDKTDDNSNSSGGSSEIRVE